MSAEKSFITINIYSNHKIRKLFLRYHQYEFLSLPSAYFGHIKRDISTCDIKSKEWANSACTIQNCAHLMFLRDNGPSNCKLNKTNFPVEAHGAFITLSSPKGCSKLQILKLLTSDASSMELGAWELSLSFPLDNFRWPE